VTLKFQLFKSVEFGPKVSYAALVLQELNWTPLV